LAIARLAHAIEMSGGLGHQIEDEIVYPAAFHKKSEHTKDKRQDQPRGCKPRRSLSP